jgi:hypothetical protein
MRTRHARRSPAFVVALIALFVALGGTAGAVVTQAVPLAKRALVADNSKKLGGQTSAQIVARATTAANAAATRAAAAPGPASTAAGVVSVKTATTTLAANGEGEVTIACDAGQKVAGGGFASDGAVFNLDSFPASDNAWRLYLVNANASAGANVTLYATCIR